MKIALGSDHRGVQAAETLSTHLRAKGHEVLFVGRCSVESCDYPEQAFAVASAVADGRADLGILACGTGIGMSIAANKVRGVRAALVSDELTAERSRAHNDANVVCVAGDLVSDREFTRIIDKWLSTAFEGGRHARRVAKIMAIERGEDPVDVTAEHSAAK